MTLTIFVWLHGIGRKFVTDLYTYEFVNVHIVSRCAIVLSSTKISSERVIGDFQDQEDYAINQRNYTYTGVVKH